MTTSPTTDDRPVLPPVPELDDASGARIRAALAAGAYGERQLQRFGKMSVYAWPVTAARLWPDLPALGTLIALFRTGQEVRVQEAEAALGPGEVAWLCDIGVLVRAGSGVRSNLRIEPYEDLLIAGDYEETDRPAFDTVQAMTPSAQTLDGFTIRDPVQSMLDLGIGSGVQAMRAANRVERVVGADLNPRALAFARFNAALNGVSNLELRLGSWLEPVQGDRFDLVLANLPFIIGPDFDLLYRNPGDTEGETFGALLKALPDVLTDGGIAQAFCHWPIRSGQTWVDPLREWTEGIDHRAVFVRIIVDDIAQYSARSVRMKDNDHELYRETVGRWLRHFTAIGIEAMGFGMVAIQRRPGPVRRLGVAALSDHRGDAAGAHVRRLLEAADRTAVLEDERTALAQRVSLLDGHELGTTAVYHEGTYAMGERVLIMDPKGLLGLSVQVPAGVVEVLRACGPERTLGEVVQDAAQRSGVNRDTIAQASLAAVRELAAKALLTVHT